MKPNQIKYKQRNTITSVIRSKRFRNKSYIVEQAILSYKGDSDE